MANVIRSEILKYRRTFTRELILLAPLFFVLVALPQRIFMPADYLRPWRLLILQIYNWWPVVFIPFGMALFAALVEAEERKAGNYRGIRALNVSPSLIWTGKITVMAIHSFVATLVLFAAVVVSGLVTAGGAIPWREIFAAGSTVWVTSLAVIPLHLWMATWKGTFASMALGFLGMITGVLAASKPYWVYVPWSWPTRLMCPVIGVHPNGIPLGAADPLMNPSVIPVGIILSIASLIAFTVITSLWFHKREAR